MSVTLEVDDEPTPGLTPEGRPDPAYAAALGLMPAPRGRRALAFAIDLAAVALVTLPLTVGAAPILFRLAFEYQDDLTALVRDDGFLLGLILYIVGQGLLSILLLVQALFHGLRGVTIGKRISGLRSVNARRFTKPGFFRVVLRALVLWTATAIVPLLGAVPFLLSPLWDRERRGRGWLDLIGANWVIDIRRGLDPFDLRALRHARKTVERPPVAEEAPLPSLSTNAAGAVASFVPAGRSSSGVISVRSEGEHDAGAPWQPPAEIASARAPLPPQPAARPAGPAALLVFDDGRRVPVTGTILLGRNPQAGDDEASVQLLQVADPTLQISKTHAAVGVDDRGFWVTDRGSSNGTIVSAPGIPPLELSPWQRMPLATGTLVELGGRSFRVEAEKE